MPDGHAPSKPQRILIQDVIKITAAHFNLTTDQLLARTRELAIARPRQIAMYAALKLSKRSLPYTGDQFGGFDHTTVMYARNKIAHMCEQDPVFKQQVDEIMKKCQAA